MIWSLVCSVYIIYLYRKLNAPAVSATPSGDTEAQAAIAALNARLDSLEEFSAGVVLADGKP